MRKLEKIVNPELYQSDSDVNQNIIEERGNFILNQEANDKLLSQIFEGQIIFDDKQKRPVTKIGDKLNKLYIDDNNEIKYKEM